MPVIKIETSADLAEEAKKSLSVKTAEAAAAALSKPLAAIQVIVCDKLAVSFAGKSDSSSAFVTVRQVGEVLPGRKDAFIAKMFPLLAEYGISDSKTYFFFDGTPIERWGWK